MLAAVAKTINAFCMTQLTHLHHRSRTAVEKLSIQVDFKAIAKKGARAHQRRRYVAGRESEALRSCAA
jgi:hypothetical protein